MAPGFNFGANVSKPASAFARKGPRFKSKAGGKSIKSRVAKIRGKGGSGFGKGSK